MSTTGPGGNASMAARTCPIIRVVVRVSKAGSLKSGTCRGHPCRAKRSARNAALVDDGRRREAVQVEEVHGGPQSIASQSGLHRQRIFPSPSV